MSCCPESNCCEDIGFQTASTTLTTNDTIGAIKMRLGIGRMSYAIPPGLYAIGNPTGDSDVLVSANYKLTFDTLRKNLDGLDIWILILDTNGINVWCAAGKGTFGTNELINRIQVANLSQYVTHKNLIVAQLGAVGISAHEVTKATGYNVIYGPVRASDIKAFIAADYTKTKEQSQATFGLWDRFVLTPMALIPVLKIAVPIIMALATVAHIGIKPFRKFDMYAFLLSIFSGAVLMPILLPFIPFKSFSAKGALVGFSTTFDLLFWSKKLENRNWRLILGHLLLFPAISSFVATQFTGSSTYTSPSGVQKEIKKSMPFIAIAGAIGLILTLWFNARRDD